MRVSTLAMLVPVPFLVLAACRTAGSAPAAEPAREPAPHGPAAHEGSPEMAGHHRPHDMQHRFEDAEAWAKHFDDPQRDAWQRPEAVIESLELAPDAVVADIGAGTGYFTVRLARAVPQGRVIATDVEPDMVRYIEERAAKASLSNVTALKTAHDAPGLPEPVDVVFLCDVVHHVADRPGFFAAVTDELREGGRVVIVDFKPDAPEGTPGPPARHRLSVDALKDELGRAGLKLLHADAEILPYQYVAVFGPAR
jgi:predicted methyltransferase